MPTTTAQSVGAYAPPEPLGAFTTQRVASIDIVRGAVMVLMAIDHVRVYAGVPAGGPDYGVFFTRWVTHFCAPGFIFLAGTSAFLYGARGRTTGELSRFLATRGAWLVLVELLFMRFAWTFNADVMNYNLAGVIWVIGWCMILLAALVHLPLKIVGAVGVVIIAGHDLLPAVLPDDGGNWLLAVLYTGGGFGLGPSGPPVLVLYTIIPWVGVMAAGYAFGAIVQMEPARRRRICYIIGLGATALFLALRGFNLYGNPWPWSASDPNLPAVLSFLNTAKYPASLQFLLMTLGPTIAVMPVLDSARGMVARALTVFGRVPFFYYVLHIPLIHVLAILVSLAREGSVNPWLFGNHPLAPDAVPEGYRWGLPLLYVVTVLAVWMLYFPCRWYARQKERKASAWLSYL